MTINEVLQGWPAKIRDVQGFGVGESKKSTAGKICCRKSQKIPVELFRSFVIRRETESSYICSHEMDIITLLLIDN